jgi:UDP-glucose 4-epimerase
MRFLITGGAGFIGSHLAERLVREQLGLVIILDNLHRGNTESLSDCRDQVSFVKGDIRNVVLLEAITQGCTHVFHLASQSNVMGAVQHPDYTLSSNIAGTHNVLQAARNARVACVVFASSREVYGESTVLLSWRMLRSCPVSCSVDYSFGTASKPSSCDWPTSMETGTSTE